MHRDDPGDALSFVNESRHESLSLRPGGKKQPSRLLPLFCLFSSFVAVVAFLNYQGFIPIPALEKLTKDGHQPKQFAAAPVIPPAPPAATLSVPPANIRRPDATRRLSPPAPALPVQLARDPQPSVERARQARLAETRGAADKPDDEPNLNAGRVPKEVLEEKGLKLAGDRFILAGREEAAAVTYNRDLSKFAELHDTFPKIYQINNLLNMIGVAEQMRAGLAFDNNDLNIEMDSVPTRGGSREQYLNNIQREMHNQLLSNRKSMADLDRTLAALRAELRKIPARDQLIYKFDTLSRTCQQSLNEIENEMNAIVAEYASLNNDRTVMDALAEINRAAKASNVIGPSDDFRDALRKFNEEKRFLQPQAPRRSNRRR